jgi:hypothetical protein
MAFTSEQITAIEKAIASGVLTVKTGDDLVTYQSVAEMLKVLQIMKSEVEPSSRRTLARFSRGLR